MKSEVLPKIYQQKTSWHWKRLIDNTSCDIFDCCSAQTTNKGLSYSFKVEFLEY